jgi:hypothetical protein
MHIPTSNILRCTYQLRTSSDVHTNSSSFRTIKDSMPEENEKRRPLKPQCSFLDQYNAYLMGKSEFNFAKQNSLLDTKNLPKVKLILP